MPVTVGAKKAYRSSSRKRVFNVRRQTTMLREVKVILKLTKEGKKEEAGKLLKNAYKAIDKAKKRGLIQRNTASRKKSRLARLVNTKN